MESIAIKPALRLVQRGGVALRLTNLRDGATIQNQSQRRRAAYFLLLREPAGRASRAPGAAGRTAPLAGHHAVPWAQA